MTDSLTDLATMLDATETIAVILRSDDPESALLSAMISAEENLDNQRVVNLFERVTSSFRIRNSWIYYTAAKSYWLLGYSSIAFVLSNFARDLVGSGLASVLIAEITLRHLESTGADHAALHVFRRHLLDYGDIVLNTDVRRYEAGMGIKSNVQHVAPGRIDVVVERETLWPGWKPWRTYGDPMPDAIADLGGPCTRSAISVATIPNGRLISSGYNFVICDAGDDIVADLSVSDAAGLIQWRWQNAPQHFEVLDAESVVLLSDRWSMANICHCLLDHLPRAELYAKAGIELRSATVLGPPIEAPFQSDLLRAAGVERYIALDRPMAISAKRLHVSSDCKNVQLSANFGSAWAQGYLLRILSRARSRPRRLLISRRDSGRRGLLNERSVMERLGPLGFEQINLGELRLDEQIQAFADATHVIGPHGAGMALMVFCEPQTFVCEIFHPGYCNGQIAMQAANRGLRYGCIFASDPNHSENETSENAQYKNIFVKMCHIEAWLSDCALI